MGVGILESWGVGSIEACMTTGDADRTCSCACEVRTRVSKEVTFDSKADIVLCAAACCACNELDSSTADSSSNECQSMYMFTPSVFSIKKILNFNTEQTWICRNQLHAEVHSVEIAGVN